MGRIVNHRVATGIVRHRKSIGKVIIAAAAPALLAGQADGAVLRWGGEGSSWNTSDPRWVDENAQSVPWDNGSDALFTFGTTLPVQADLNANRISLINESTVTLTTGITLIGEAAINVEAGSLFQTEAVISTRVGINIFGSGTFNFYGLAGDAEGDTTITGDVNNGRMSVKSTGTRGVAFDVGQPGVFNNLIMTDADWDMNSVAENIDTLSLYNSTISNGNISLKSAYGGTGSNTVNSNLHLGNGGVTFDITADSSTTINGVIDGLYDDPTDNPDEGMIQGVGGLTKTGNGTLTLGGDSANLYQGDTRVESGILQSAKNDAITANTAVVITGGAWDMGGYTNEVNLLTMSDNTQVYGVGTMTIDYGVTTAGTTSINGGGIYTDVAAKFEIEGELTINSGFSGNGSIDKTGTGTLILNGESSLIGGVYITLGTVKSGVASAVGTGPVSVGLGGTWDMGGFETTIYSLSVDGTLTNLGGVISTNDITLGDSGEMAELTILQNQYLTSYTQIVLGLNSGSNATVNLNAGGLSSQYDIKVGVGGTATLNIFDGGASGFNLYVGQTGVGKVNLSGGSLTGETLTVGSTSGESQVNLTGGSVELNGSASIGVAQDTHGAVSISGGTLWASSLQLGDSAQSDPIGNLVLDGGTLRINESIAISRGTLNFNGGEILGGTGHALIIFDRGTFNMNNPAGMVSERALNNDGVFNNTPSSTPTGGVSFLYGGTSSGIFNLAAGTQTTLGGNFQWLAASRVRGSGTIIIEGGSNYIEGDGAEFDYGFTGNVDIVKGNLYVAGGLSKVPTFTIRSAGQLIALSGFSVKAGQTVAAAGNLLSADPTIVFESLSTLSPGDAPGAFGSPTVNALAFQNGARLAIDVRVGTAEPDAADKLHLIGTLDLGDAELVLSLTTGEGPLASPVDFVLVDNDEGEAIVGTFAGIADNVQYDLNGILYSLNYAGGDGNDLILTVHSVPEPASLGMVAMAAAGVMTRRRRRRAAGHVPIAD